jgi:hypothetical protein
MIIKRLAPDWYRLNTPGDPYYADLRQGPEGSWQGSIRTKRTNLEVGHTEPFRRLTDARQAAEQLVTNLAHSEPRPGD